MLSIRSLSKRYPGGTVALSDFSLTLGEGVLGLLGPNGAGKTTLMSILATVTAARPAARVRWAAPTRVADPLAVRRELGYLPQDFGVYEQLTARELLRYFGRLKGLAGAELDAPRRGDARARQPAGAARPAARRLLGRHAAARRHRPGAARRPEAR